MAKKKDYSNHPQVKLTKVIGAKVEKAVTETVDSVVESGSSFFQSVVDTASQALESGAEFVSDAADDIYEALPEMEDVEDAVTSTVDKTRAVGSAVGSAATTVIDTMDKTSLSVVPIVKAAASTPIVTMLDDIFVPAMGRKITEKNFSPEASEILRQMAIDNNLKAGDSMEIDYNDFNKYGAKLSARFVSGSNEDVASLIDKLANIEPADEVKMTLGEANITVDEDGNIKVIDQYDFNSWVHYGAGKNSKGKYPKITADEFEKSDISFTEAFMDTIKNSPSDYQMMRNLAFLFGSRDYEDDTRDTGRKVEINLGKIK